MNKIAKFTGLMFVAAIMTFSFASESEAVPTFARQTGYACSTCHFNTFPTLNSFGRAFKASGFTTMGGSQGLIEGEGLSIPDTLNASLITKLRYQQSSTKGGNAKSGTDKGEWQFPDEAALFLGGRAGEHIGFMLEFNMGTPNGASFASYKMPIGIWSADDKHLEIIPFLTDAAGAPFATEVLNTGAVRPVRTWEARKSISAQQYLGTDGAAEGFALAYYSDIFHASATLWGPAHGAADTGFDLSQYFRAVVTPQVGAWDLAAGVQLWTGETKVGDTAANPADVFKTNATAIDAQAQGMVGDMPLGVYASYAVAPKASSGSTSTNLFNQTAPKDRTAIAASVELGVLPNKVSVGAGVRMGDNGANTDSKDDAMMLGVKYMLAANSQVQLNYEAYSGSAVKTGSRDSMTTLMLFSAF